MNKDDFKRFLKTMAVTLFVSIAFALICVLLLHLMPNELLERYQSPFGIMLMMVLQAAFTISCGQLIDFKLQLAQLQKRQTQSEPDGNQT